MCRFLARSGLENCFRRPHSYAGKQPFSECSPRFSVRRQWVQGFGRGDGSPYVTPKEVLALIREKEVKSVDLRFMDFPGLWQHFAVPADAISEDTFTDGLGFDGSSIRGWQAINESDMLVMPQAETAIIDPFMKHTTLAMICNIHDPL